MYDYVRKFIVPILIITSFITFIAIFFERLRDKKIKLERDLLEMKDKTIEGDTKKRLLSFKDGENHYVMECSDIIYLSSYGRKTIIHTANRDYETSVLLKEIVRKLPPDEFVRIHKRFTVNLRYVSRVQYYEGGRYRVYLEDDDDSTLPVGPTFTSILKARLQI
jgi:DNA-binding LytR/AlgR family response regulator